MSNFLGDLEKEIDGEEVLGVVLGDWGFDWNEDYQKRNAVQKDQLLTWNAAKPHLDYEYDTGYGGPECHPILIWTETRIITVDTYDGATSVIAYPRHPTSCKPFFAGGG